MTTATTQAPGDLVPFGSIAVGARFIDPRYEAELIKRGEFHGEYASKALGTINSFFTPRDLVRAHPER